MITYRDILLTPVQLLKRFWFLGRRWLFPPKPQLMWCGRVVISNEYLVGVITE